ncbi:hypothetical protein FDB55_15135 [Clostridium botulinum]|uniref:Uncharacterized protein n=1 Tax=Clostridium botulinum TaxID=1491 RepID=A0A0C2S1U7_CLOBO|nr:MULTISPECIES: DUF5692 family protein [Clostridium]ACD52111.1 putative membrane protein [Clostridium botulinum E3 str. Alaska E43]AJF29559.1 membrane protein [Clostridium botulinum]AJF32620.1 membrane protein [Clostridium botulinum]EES50624.1 putative membrane protein [Clostridium botulinum E1 str. 'BoNT E Beluga']KAI3349799.1 DUF5692 family protein [Clostridium botulinum]
MFFFEAQPFTNWIMLLIVFIALILLNELGRRFKWGGVLLFIILPLFLTFFVWPKTTEGTSVNDWFHYAKVYSSLAGCIGFFLIRHIKGASSKKWALCFPPLILAINICEAVARDFQIYGLHLNKEVFEGMVTLSGSWNIMNGIAGILNIITITGWFGICISKDKSKDMLWPDMLWFWIIAYDIWNFAYTYNCLPNHAWYCGIALLLAPTIAAFFIKKGAWLQHRAQTLALWCMFAMTCPSFIDESQFAVRSSHNSTALFIVSLAALLSNIAVFVYYIYKIKKTKRNPIKAELYTDLNSYKEIKTLSE